MDRPEPLVPGAFELETPGLGALGRSHLCRLGPFPKITSKNRSQLGTMLAVLTRFRGSVHPAPTAQGSGTPSTDILHHRERALKLGSRRGLG